MTRSCSESMRSTSAGSDAARERIRGEASTSIRTGLPPTASQRSGSMAAKVAAPSGSHDQR